MNDFLPQGYQPPQSSGGYYKFEQGENRFRVVSQKPIIGYEYWTPDNKPVRVREMPKEEPKELRKAKGRETEHWMSSIKHFWAFAVYSYRDQRVQVLEITQTTIQNALTSLFQNEDWGHPSSYDISITREGEGMDTRYAVMPNPHKELSKDVSQAIKDAPVRLEALYESGDPFDVSEAPSINDF